MSETNSSPSRDSGADSAVPAEYSSLELDPEFEELCRAQNRDLAAATVLRLLVPFLFVAVLVTIGAWAYIQFATTRNEIRAKTEGDPAKAMELLIRATGEDGNKENLFSRGNEFEPVEFDTHSFQIPTLENPRKRN